MIRCLLLLLLVLAAGPALAQAPDLVLTGGRIFTADPARLWAQALAVRGGRVVAVGSTAAIGRLAGPRTRRVALGGRTVVPGFNDAHAHLPPGYPGSCTFVFPQAPLLSGPDPAALLDTLATLAARIPAGTWLEGDVGLRVLRDPRPWRAVLDATCPHHPVALHTPWGHGAWYNSAGLQALGLTETTPDPVGGTLARDATGHLTGWLTEYADWNARRELQGRLPDSLWARQLRQYGQEAVQWGVTSVQDMASELPPAQMLRVTHLAHLPLRHRLIAFPLTTPAGIRYGEWRGLDPHPAPLARLNGVKYILDGTPVGQDAAVVYHYPGRPDWFGHLDFPRDTLKRILSQALLPGAEPLLLHVVGDRTARQVLGLMGRDYRAWPARRVRFEHGDGLGGDLRRVRDFGIVVVQNPTHHLNPAVDAQFGVPDSLSHAPFASLLAAGIPLAFGSDGPANPFLNILAAITLAASTERLTRAQAVQAYTTGSAYAEFAEREKGQLAPGYLADLAVLSQDLFTVPAKALPATTSLLTLVGGRVVWAAGPFRGLRQDTAGTIR